jgi:hypothetical protein
VTVEDLEGQVLDDDDTAVSVGDELAWRVFKARPGIRAKGYSILVKNSEGREIYRALVQELVIRPALSR